MILADTPVKTVTKETATDHPSGYGTFWEVVPQRLGGWGLCSDKQKQRGSLNLSVFCSFQAGDFIQEKQALQF